MNASSIAQLKDWSSEDKNVFFKRRYAYLFSIEAIFNNADTNRPFKCHSNAKNPQQSSYTIRKKFTIRLINRQYNKTLACTFDIQVCKLKNSTKVYNLKAKLKYVPITCEKFTQPKL